MAEGAAVRNLDTSKLALAQSADAQNAINEILGVLRLSCRLCIVDSTRPVVFPANVPARHVQYVM